MKSIKKVHIALFFALMLMGNVGFSQRPAGSVHNFLTLKIADFIPENPVHRGKSIVKSLTDHIQKLEKVKARDSGQEQLLHAIFYKTHRKFLKQYDPFSTFGETMDTGKYGCLSGTALYAILLDYFDFEYNIKELTNHVYLEVYSNERIFTFESTDPGKGLSVIDTDSEALPKPIVSSIRKRSSLQSIGATAENRSSYLLNSELTLTELAGLQYYNQSIYVYEEGDYPSALEKIEKAFELYDSKRTRKMMQFVISTILRSKKISGKDKQKYLKQYITQVQQKKLSQTL